MSETYTAWDGKQYPAPPPEGWQLRSDGRYWPPEEAAPAAAVPPPATAPPPAAAPPAAAPPQQTPQPQTFQQQSVPQQQNFNPGAPPEVKSSKTGLIVLLVLLGVLVLAFGGCTLFVIRAANTIEDGVQELEESVEEFEQNQIEARQEVSIDSGTCEIVDGRPTATVLIENRSGGRSDYEITVTFTGEDNLRLTDGSTSVNSVEDGDDARLPVTSLDSGLTGDLTCEVGNVIRYSSNISTN